MFFMGMFLLVLMTNLSTAMTSLVSCKAYRKTSMERSMTTSYWVISETNDVKTVLDCVLVCVHEERCASFVYNKVLHNCTLFAIVMSPVEMTITSHDNDRFYESCRGQGYYGATCSADGECRMTNSRCFQSRCRCEQGHSFDPNTGSCVTRCSSYGPEFQQWPDMVISGYNEETFPLVSFPINEAFCLEKCLAATSYVCRSVDYRMSAPAECSLGSVVSADTPNSYYNISGSTWVTIHYQRHCSL